MALPQNPFLDKKCIQIENKLRRTLENKMSTAGADIEHLDVELDQIMMNKMNDATSKIISTIIPDGLIKKFP